MLADLDPPVQGVVVASPANPTGTVIPPEELAAIASWCETTGVRLISDEVYHGLVYAGRSCHQLRMADITRCRSGQQLFEVLRDDWLAARLAAGAAGVAARGRLPDGQFHHLSAGAVASCCRRGVHARVGRRGRRAPRITTRPTGELLLDGLREIGIDRLAPADGAFYVYADVSHLTTDSLSFCSKLLNDTGVAIAPGIDFDTVRGGLVRAAVVRRAPRATSTQALRRIGSWLGSSTASQNGGGS